MDFLIKCERGTEEEMERDIGRVGVGIVVGGGEW